MQSVSFHTSAVVETDLATTYKPRWISQVYADDLNHDGYSDLLVLGASYPSDGAPVAQPSFVAFGSASGTFSVATQAQFPFASLSTVHPREVVFADFNGDGFDDVFVASHGYDAPPFPGEQNRLYLSNGDGTWRNATASLPQLSDYSHSATAGDIDGDGDLDIVVGNQTPAAAPYVLVNDGAGNFTRTDTILPTSAGGALDMSVRRVTSTLLADLDGDGRPDLVAGAAFSTDAQPVTSLVLWNQGGTFSGSSATVLPYPATFGKTQLAYDVQAMDVNYDGRPDLIVAYQHSTALGGWELQVLVNEGNRQFSDQTATYLPAVSMRTNGIPSSTDPLSQYWVQFIDVADVNGDGRPDFTLNARGITSAPSTLPVAYVHQADGTFSAATVSDLGGAANSWIFDFSTVYAREAGTGGFVHVYANPSGTPVLHLLPVAFDPVLPVRDDLLATPQTIRGGAGNDVLTGGVANDNIGGGPGNDTITAGAGLDTIVYSGARSNYTITATASGFTVSDKTGAEGTDTLLGAERLTFGDRHVALDIDGHAGMAYRLYQAAFARVPDLPGLGYQMNALDIGLSITDVAGNFIASPEFQATYGTLNNVQFVTQLYHNVLHRDPDAGGLAFHVANLDAGLPRSYVLVGFSESPENKINVIGAIQNGMDYIL